MYFNFNAIERATGRRFDNEKDLLDYAQRAITFLAYPNKNLTNEQYAKVCDLESILRNASTEQLEKLRVCAHCLAAIESREGRQITLPIHLDDDEPLSCDWCGEDFDDVLYEIQ